MSVFADEIIAVISIDEENSAVAAFAATYAARGRVVTSDFEGDMRTIIVAEHDGVRFICFSAKSSDTVYKQLTEYGYIII